MLNDIMRSCGLYEGLWGVVPGLVPITSFIGNKSTGRTALVAQPASRAERPVLYVLISWVSSGWPTGRHCRARRSAVCWADCRSAAHN